VIESTGFQALIDDAMKCLCNRGRFVFEGHYPGTITHTFKFPHEKQVRAFYPCFIGDPPVRQAVLRLMASSRLDIEPLISHLVPWREAAAVYNKLFTPERNRFNGIVFDWSLAGA
jgi:threonine dehydrogenase-like Zn-dependent dehydrogenase